MLLLLCGSIIINYPIILFTDYKTKETKLVSTYNMLYYYRPQSSPWMNVKFFQDTKTFNYLIGFFNYLHVLKIQYYTILQYSLLVFYQIFPFFIAGLAWAGESIIYLLHNPLYCVSDVT